MSSTFLDERRHIAVVFALAGEERFEMSGNDSKQRILFRIARPVDVLGSHKDIPECKPRRIGPLHRDSNLRLAAPEKIRRDRDN